MIDAVVMESAIGSSGKMTARIEEGMLHVQIH